MYVEEIVKDIRRGCRQAEAGSRKQRLTANGPIVPGMRQQYRQQYQNVLQPLVRAKQVEIGRDGPLTFGKTWRSSCRSRGGSRAQHHNYDSMYSVPSPERDSG